MSERKQSGTAAASATRREVKRAVVLAAGRGTRLVSQEDFPKPLKPVAGVALNTSLLDDAAAARAIDAAAAETGLPAADPVRDAAGADRLARALLG